MASKFWVGGTGTWDATTTTHWSATTGGAGGVAVPGTTDTVTFDASSGGGTVTADTTINGLTFAGITMGAFTGTLDFSVNNPSITTSFLSATGAGTRTLKMGSGTWTLNGANTNVLDLSTVTGLTFTPSAPIIIAAPSGSQNQTFVGNSTFTHPSVTVNSRTNQSDVSFSGTNNITALAINAPAVIVFSGALNVTNAVSWAGTSSTPLLFQNSLGSINGTLTLSGGGTISWAGFRSVTFAGTAPTVTNSFDFGSTSGATINPPTSGGASVFGS